MPKTEAGREQEENGGAQYRQTRSGSQSLQPKLLSGQVHNHNSFSFSLSLSLSVFILFILLNYFVRIGKASEATKTIAGPVFRTG
jgi:hypothetical protein